VNADLHDSRTWNRRNDMVNTRFLDRNKAERALAVVRRRLKVRMELVTSSSGKVHTLRIVDPIDMMRIPEIDGLIAAVGRGRVLL